MQTSPSEVPVSSDRRFPTSTHLRPATIGIVPRPSHVRPRLHPSSPGQPSGLAAEQPARDVSSRFGVRLRELRRERNLTQLRMANDFGIDRSFISDVERGRKSISLPMLEVIALGMKLTLSELLRDI
jgi:DNA-binding XRE family transcriptional regulator